MRAVQMTGIDRIAATEVPDPRPGPDEVLVRVEASAVCRTDLQILRGDLPTHKLPLIPGHQVVGTETGTGRRVGLVWLAQTCGHCRFCLSGRENLCDRARFTGWDRDGGYAELVTAHRDFVHPLPEGAPVAMAPLLCGLPLAARGRARPRLGRCPAWALRLRRVGHDRDPGRAPLGL